MWPIDGPLKTELVASFSITGTNNSSQNGPDHNDNEGVLIIKFLSVTPRIFVGGGVLPFYRSPVGIFYSPSRLGYHCDLRSDAINKYWNNSVTEAESIST